MEIQANSMRTGNSNRQSGLIQSKLEIECDLLEGNGNGRLKFMFRGDLDSTFNIDRVLNALGVPRLSGGKICIENYDPSRLYEQEDFI